jgi:hypothetical protein
MCILSHIHQHALEIIQPTQHIAHILARATLLY